MPNEPGEYHWYAFFFDLADKFFVWFRRSFPPKILASILVGGLIAIGIAAYARTENWPEWFSVFGFFVTFFGFLFTLYQLNETKILDQVRADEYKRASQEFSRMARNESSKHYRYCLETAKGALDGIKEHERKSDWKVLMVKMETLIDLLRHLNSITDSANERWKHSTQALRIWQQVFANAPKTGQSFDGYSPAEWLRDIDEISDILAAEIGSFYTGGDDFDVT